MQFKNNFWQTITTQNAVTFTTKATTASIVQTTKDFSTCHYSKNINDNLKDFSTCHYRKNIDNNLSGGIYFCL